MTYMKKVKISAAFIIKRYAKDCMNIAKLAESGPEDEYGQQELPFDLEKPRKDLVSRLYDAQMTALALFTVPGVSAIMFTLCATQKKVREQLYQKAMSEKFR